jgi:hypothetical protein
MLTVSSFLAEFVAEDRRDRARESMGALFAQMHLTLATEFFDSYKDIVAEKAPTLLAQALKAPAPPQTTSKKVPFPLCTGLTAKGEPCTRRCCPESAETFCATHLAQSLKPVKEAKAPAAQAPASKKAMRAQVPVCSGKTAKNEACTRKCCPESDIFCSTHLAQSLKPVKEKKVKEKQKTEKKAKSAPSQKPIPTHNHALTEEVEAAVAANCDLCQSHGNAADPELTGTQFEEISGDLQSRLKSILANLHEVEDEDDEDDDEDNEAESALVKPDDADQDEEDQAFGDAALESEPDDDEEGEEEEEFDDEESEAEVDED